MFFCPANVILKLIDQKTIEAREQHLLETRPKIWLIMKKENTIHMAHTEIGIQLSIAYQFSRTNES